MLPPKINDKSYLTQVAIRYLSLRPRFSCELNSKLRLSAKQKHISNPGNIIAEIISNLTSSGFLNDDTLATEYCRYQLCSKFKGPRFIRFHLFRLGLPKNLIDQALNTISRDDQIQAIVQYMNKKKQPYIKIYRQLIARGFDASLVATAVDEQGSTR